LSVYSAATEIDNCPGSYPPDDTGSDGLSVAKVLQNRGLISGYKHAFSYAALTSALQVAPCIVGVNWYEGMFKPDANGEVHATGAVAGGHEFVIDELRADGSVGCQNSWGAGWGVDNGRFYMSAATITRLLGEQGDVTQFVPITAPAPTPTPTPVPVADPDLSLWESLRPWAEAHHVKSNATAAALVRSWAALKGFS
jgi:hypothetical protein